MHPDSARADELEWLIECDAIKPRVARRAIELRVIDPACGTMNFGLVAIDLLRRMYAEELECAGRPGWPAEPSVRSGELIADCIARHNLHGIDIDSVALELASASVEMKLRVAPKNLHRGDALFEFEHLNGAFDVVVTNPPFLSARNLPPENRCKTQNAYPRAWRDACACFIDRSLQFARPGGRVGVLAMQSFMFTGAFERFRRGLADSAATEAIAHFGPGVFDLGNPGTLQTTAIVLRREEDREQRARQRVRAYRLIDVDDKEAALRQRTNAHVIEQRQMISGPRAAWVYWLPPRVREIFATLPKLGDLAPPRQGLATTDNARFVRYWWEVGKRTYAQVVSLREIRPVPALVRGAAPRGRLGGRRTPHQRKYRSALPITCAASGRGSRRTASSMAERA
jgi:type I restriction-modification system DNA methylase subunit